MALIFDDVKLSVNFTEAEERCNLVCDENISESFGKIAKVISDLKPAAFGDVDVLTLKGRVASVEDLPESASVGDVYLVGEESAEEVDEYVYTSESCFKCVRGGY